MKKKLLYSLIYMVLLSILSLSLYSCKDALEVKPENTLDPSRMYRNRFDADAAVFGIYGKFLDLAKQYVVLNELRADLMDVTYNADPYLLQLNAHNVTEGNPYADPKPFYEVILSCNDALKNFDIMLQENKLTQDEYNQRYSDIGALRCWVYLQLGIHFGSVPYVTDPIEKVDDLNNQSKFPVISFEELLEELVTFMESTPYQTGYPLTSLFYTVVDTYNTEKFFINKYCILGDLYLWKGEYTKAATNYKAVIGNVSTDTYKVIWADVQNNNDLSVRYIRYREQDINTLINSKRQGWKSMFARGQDALFNTEWIWVVFFDKNFKPEYPLIDLFSNRGGEYLVKPSQAAIDNWSSQVQNNSFPFDARGLFTWQNVSGQPVIMKYIYNYDPTIPTERGGKLFLYRAATMHLRFAEAANRDGRNRIAWGLLNRGIRPAFDFNPANQDQTNKQQTFDVPPYDFDARYGTSGIRYRSLWHKNNGIRGRANVTELEIDSVKFFDITTKALINPEGFTSYIEEKLLDEAALELAYEGNRWPDLLRIALRRTDDPAFLADKIYTKLQKAGNPQAEAVRARLMDKANWYLPFKWK